MVRNIVVIGGTSHPQLTQTICDNLGIPPASVLLSKFSVGETRVEIHESVREKDVYIIQSGGGKVNDHLIELLITISACKTASARKVTAVLPLFPYSRQSDIPYNKSGAPLVKSTLQSSSFTFDSIPPTPYPEKIESSSLVNGIDCLQNHLTNAQIDDRDSATSNGIRHPCVNGAKRRDTLDSTRSENSHFQANSLPATPGIPNSNGTPHEEAINARAASSLSIIQAFEPRPGYRQWVAQAGTLVADLLTCAGADHIITMDLHDPQYQGFFDIPVDNLHGRPLLRRYIQRHIPEYRNAIIVSPDAGGAKRATVVADSMGMDFALIHKERRPIKSSDRQNATMMLVGDVRDRIAILIDDLADTSNTITRAAKLLKKEGASQVYALITHGILSGDAIERINASVLDKVVVTNTVDQEENLKKCPKLEVLEVGHVFAEAIRRVHHGESISVLFQYD
ncbi:hypothetical protein Egran_02332 [Elaphomyces granulatus]|uniref:Ribose-phosphate pyrophosphokinase N-terminal domain-containing protein n=1 Tax=Elaphomyces granulatus TaxID=519963 RepID=A0A232M0G9_9EURO|nr:hypothetical protein Egran_02332 [Elaphomyces granulatus]